MAPALIYHMCREEEWRAALATGRYAGSDQDAADGFIHFSTAAQIEESAARHRAGQQGLVLLAVDPAGVSFLQVCIILLAAGCGVGPMYPVTTIVIQNVVLPHQLGTATGTLNFFRQLGGAIIVAAFGAIVLGALGAAGPETALERLSSIDRAGADFAAVFRWLFIAAVMFLGLSAVALMLVEERPLRGRGEPL